MKTLITLTWRPHSGDQYVDDELLARLADRLRVLLNHHGVVDVHLFHGGVTTLSDRVTTLEAENRMLRDANMAWAREKQEAWRTANEYKAELAVYQEVCEGSCALVVAARQRSEA